MRLFREYILSDEAAEFLKARRRATNSSAGTTATTSRASSFDSITDILQFDDSYKRHKRKRVEQGKNAGARASGADAEAAGRKKITVRPPAMTRERRADMASGEALNVCAELRAVMRTLGDGDYHAFPPVDLLRSVWTLVPTFAGNEQQDAHEFMRFLLDRLRKELSSGRHAVKMRGVVTPRRKEHSPCEDGIPQPPTRARSSRSRSGRASPSVAPFLQCDNDDDAGSSSPVQNDASASGDDDGEREGGYIIVSRWGAKRHKVGCPCRPCKSRRRRDEDAQDDKPRVTLSTNLSTPSGSVLTSPSRLSHGVTADEVRRQLTEMMSPSSADAPRASSPASPLSRPKAEREDPSADKIMEIFGGVAVTRVTCMNCESTSVRKEPFLDLSLPIPPVAGVDGSPPPTPISPSCEPEVGEGPNGEATLQQCLAAFTRNETLSGHGRYFCERCGEVQRATKSTKIGKLPPVLCLHLKRFTWRGNASRAKITSNVDFPLDNLDLAPYSEFDDNENDGASDGEHAAAAATESKPRRTPRRRQSTPTPPASARRLNALYDLTAVVTHHGSNAGSGHYTACARDVDSPTDGDWQHFNDDEVNALTNEEVRTGQGYLFLYTRKSIKSDDAT